MMIFGVAETMQKVLGKHHKKVEDRTNVWKTKVGNSENKKSHVSGR